MYYFSNMNYNTDTTWSLIDQAVKNNWLIGVDTSASPLYGLPASHAYTVLGNYPLKDAAGNVVHRLIHVRNPWS